MWKKHEKLSLWTKNKWKTFKSASKFIGEFLSDNWAWRTLGKCGDLSRLGYENFLAIDWKESDIGYKVLQTEQRFPAQTFVHYTAQNFIQSRASNMIDAWQYLRCVTVTWNQSDSSLVVGDDMAQC